MSERDRHALLSAWNKDGLERLGEALVEAGYHLIASGGTAEYLREHGLEVQPLAELTGFGELLGGRVKTLHPAVYAGILFRRGDQPDLEDLQEAGAPQIDLVAVDLYPFTDEVTRETPEDEAVELIDIGGVSLLRAAAKNHRDVTVVCDRADWTEVAERALDGTVDSEYRRELAAKAFRLTSEYDRFIAQHLEDGETDAGSATEDGLPAELELNLSRQEELRYGENPHQLGARFTSPGLPAVEFTKHQGKPMSYNNYLDAGAALGAVRGGWDGRLCIAVIKHLSPCCIAAGDDPVETWDRALDCDPMSAFGSVIAVSTEVTGKLAERITENFRDVVLAPVFSEAALETFAEKQNLRVLEVDGDYLDQPVGENELEVRTTPFGQLVQTADALVEGPEDLECVSEREFPADRLEDAALGARWIRHHRSNTIILVKRAAQVGYGVGQTSRVKAAEDAVELAGEQARGSVLISDAFFPFEDAIEAAYEAGVELIAAPGGSIRDEQVLEWCDEHGVAVVRINRHFRH